MFNDVASSCRIICLTDYRIPYTLGRYIVVHIYIYAYTLNIWGGSVYCDILADLDVSLCNVNQVCTSSGIDIGRSNHVMVSRAWYIDW